MPSRSSGVVCVHEEWAQERLQLDCAWEWEGKRSGGHDLVDVEERPKSMPGQDQWNGVDKVAVGDAASRSLALIYKLCREGESKVERRGRQQSASRSSPTSKV